MIEDLLKNETFLRWFPLVAGLVFISVFISLGMWQLDRAREKDQLLASFETDEGYVEPDSFDALDDFERIKVFGRFLSEQHILIDNIPRDGQLGYYVVTPFELSVHDSLLLINRGWVAKASRSDLSSDLSADLAIDSEYRSVHGMAGHLPRVAIRPGEAFELHDTWPRIGLYPNLEEVAAELGQAVLPSILLLHPEAADGFVRRWQPDISGPMTHYSYAFQWFVMAMAVAAIAGWQTSKRFIRESADR